MKEDFFSFSLYTFVDFQSESDFIKLWKILLDERLEATNFGVTEKTKHEIDRSSHKNLYEYYLENGDFFVKGKNVLFWLKNFTHNVYKITIYLYSKSDLENLVLFINNLVEEIPSIYGFGRTSQEYQYKNETIEYFEGGGSARGAVGISYAEFTKYLPGIYWSTYFGSQILEFFGSDMIKRFFEKFTDNLIILENHSGILFYQKYDPFLSTNEEISMIEVEIANFLGKEYFFNRNLVGVVDFKPIPTILEKIK
jgi:hypothetical protein